MMPSLGLTHHESQCFELLSAQWPSHLQHPVPSLPAPVAQEQAMIPAPAPFCPRGTRACFDSGPRPVRDHQGRTATSCKTALARMTPTSRADMRCCLRALPGHPREQRRSSRILSGVLMYNNPVWAGCKKNVRYIPMKPNWPISNNARRRTAPQPPRGLSSASCSDGDFTRSAFRFEEEETIKHGVFFSNNLSGRTTNPHDPAEQLIGRIRKPKGKPGRPFVGAHGGGPNPKN